MQSQLGSIIFKNSFSFQELSKTSSVSYAEHAVLDSKPILQKTGQNLDELLLSMFLHISFCNPPETLSQLKAFMNDGEILPLIWGSGVVEGKYVISEINEIVNETDQYGRIFSYNINAILKEYVSPSPLQDEQEQHRKNASAVGDKRPVAKKKTNAGTCPKTISDIVTKIENHGKEINIIILEKGGNTTVVNHNKLLSHASAIRLLDEDLIRRCNDSQSCASKYPDLKYQAEQLLIQITFFNQEVAGNTQRVPNEARNTVTRIGMLKAAARPLVNQSITRKP